VKKSFLVIALLVIGCSFASAQTFSFWNSAGTIEYCNFNVVNSPASGIAAGYDNTTTGCFFAYNSPIVGFNATTPASSLPAHGKGIVVGDGLYDDSWGSSPVNGAGSALLEPTLASTSVTTLATSDPATRRATLPAMARPLARARAESPESNESRLM
jgi:hypothetical protein